MEHWLTKNPLLASLFVLTGTLVLFGAHLAFLYLVMGRPDAEKRRVMEQGRSVTADFKEVRYAQGLKWNRYAVVASATDPETGETREYSSELVPGTAPKVMPERFTVYLDDSGGYYMDVSRLRSGWIWSMARIIGTCAAIFAVLATGALLFASAGK